MELAELQRQWQQLDQKLDHALRLESETLRQAIVSPARRRMNVMAVWPSIDIVFCVVILLAVGSFVGDHWRIWSLAAPAIIVMAGAGALLASSIHQLVRVTEMDWFEPVAKIQSGLSRLRIAKITQFKWVILCSPLIGFCGLIVCLQMLLNQLPEPQFIFDILNPWWIASNYVLGVLFIPFGQLVIRFIANRCGGQGWRQRIVDDISGTSIKQIQRDLDRWSELYCDVES